MRVARVELEGGKASETFSSFPSLQGGKETLTTRNTRVERLHVDRFSMLSVYLPVYLICLSIYLHGIIFM